MTQNDTRDLTSPSGARWLSVAAARATGSCCALGKARFEQRARTQCTARARAMLAEVAPAGHLRLGTNSAHPR